MSERRWRGIDDFVQERSGTFVDNGGGRERRPDRRAYDGILPPAVVAAADQVVERERESARNNPRGSKQAYKP